MKHSRSTKFELLCSSLLMIILSHCLNAQNIRNERMEIKYLLPPSHPFRVDASKYRIVVDVISLPFAYSTEGLINEIKYYGKLYGKKYRMVESGADIEINVRMDRFITETPRIDSKNVTTENKDKTKTTTTYYSAQTMVALPMFVRIRDLKEDKIIYEDFISESNQLRDVKAEGFRSSKEANDYLNSEVRKRHDELLKSLKVGLANLMELRFSFYPSIEYWAINYVETSKKGNYDDIVLAKNATMKILDSLTDESSEIDEGRKASMLKVIDQWQVILKESNIEDRKARIDKKVTLAINENLAYCNYFIWDFTEAQKYLNAARGIQKASWQYALEKNIADMKQRFDANGIAYQ